MDGEANELRERMSDDTSSTAAWSEEQVWVRLADSFTPEPEIRWRIDGNAHTHRGRLHVSAIGHDLQRTISLRDIVEASPGAQLWLAGFLNGQQVNLFEFMGSSIELLDAYDEGDPARHGV